MKILVTGADGGIGSATVETLTNTGHSIISSTTLDTDLTQTTSIKELKGRVGDVDWVVCTHGHIALPEDVEKTFGVNILSLFYLAHEFANSNMIVISSSAGLKPNGKYPAYSASKAAAHAFIQAKARNREDLTFIAVAPGPTNTSMRERIAGDAAQMQSPSVIAGEIKKIISRETDYTSGSIVLIKDGITTIVA